MWLTGFNKPARTSSILLAVALLVSLPAAGQSLNSGALLPQCRPAWVLERGHLTAHLHSGFWGRAAQQSYPPYGAPGTRNIWDLQSTFALNYGLGAHLEVQILPVLYQSLQAEGGRFGHDITLALTLGSFQKPGKSWFLGLQTAVLMPSGLGHNLLFEPYSPSRHAFTLTALASWAADSEFPAESVSAHLNLGCTLYDDVGLRFADRILRTESYALKRSQNLAWSAGLSLPRDYFDWGLETYGLTWIQKPPAGAEGREDYLYACLSMRYKPWHWLHLSLALDRRLSSGTDETIPSLAARGLGALPNYPAWRLELGLHFKLLPVTLILSDDREILLKRGEERSPVVEQILDNSTRGAESKDDLERLRAERERAEKELERLRRVIETRQQEEKKPAPDQNL
ncbi:MAG TPA: hypothetical protein PLG50_07765 [bacterium]|nr:hypothetical protein [bacterium]HQG45541.1 hypothetical protein [bacterium]HQI49038.1 hypothetical protein [bacterium]HQJ65058.1 hypothetical protein [bacterium]